MKRAAFTLIELLVALSIVGVLVAILFPIFAGSRAASQSARCQGNLRQIGVALTLFATENDNILCQSAYGSSSAESDTGNNYKWMDAIFPYAPDERLFVCPADVGGKYRYAKNLPSGRSKDYGSYGLNGAYRDLGDGQTPPRSAGNLQVNRLQLAEPAQTVWVTDCNNRKEANGSFGFSWANSGTNPTITKSEPRTLEAIIERHRAATNVLFCDGHVEKKRLEALATKRTVVDPIDGATRTVMPFFTIEAD